MICQIQRFLSSYAQTKRELSRTGRYSQMSDLQLKRNIPEFIIILFGKLRRYGIPLGISNYKELKEILSEGFGLESREDLCSLCCLLWAKSREDYQTIEEVFEESFLLNWPLPKDLNQIIDKIGSIKKVNTPGPKGIFKTKDLDEYSGETRIKTQPITDKLPPLEFDDSLICKEEFILKSVFPVSHRELIQMWRRLRRPLREGPLVDVDIDATIEKICKSGVASEVILKPRRRNILRLILLVDRKGSMSPFHRYVDHICNVICESGRYENTLTYYFHNVPVQGADRTVLSRVSNLLFPEFSSLMKEIVPFDKGFLYTKSNFSEIVPVSNIIANCDRRTAVVIISDAGAARNNYNLYRILDTLAFLKAINKNTCRFVWLNPSPEEYWKYNDQNNGIEIRKNNTATQISKNVPMFTLDKSGVKKAVTTLQNGICMREYYL